MSTDPMSNEGLDIGMDTNILDEPGKRVQFRVEAADDPGQMELRLEVEPQITWWKSASYFQRINGNNIEWKRIETKDDVKFAEILLPSYEILQWGYIELWKGGVAGFGARAGAMDIHSWANRGRKLIFHWWQD